MKIMSCLLGWWWTWVVQWALDIFFFFFFFLFVFGQVAIKLFSLWDNFWLQGFLIDSKQSHNGYCSEITNGTNHVHIHIPSDYHRLLLLILFFLLSHLLYTLHIFCHHCYSSFLPFQKDFVFPKLPEFWNIRNKRALFWDAFFWF